MFGAICGFYLKEDTQRKAELEEEPGDADAHLHEVIIHPPEAG